MSATISAAIHGLFVNAAGTYDVVFGTDAGAFFVDVEQKSNENLPFFGVFDTLRTQADAYGLPHPIYAVYAFFSPDWADEAKEVAEEEITAAGLLRSFLANLSPSLFSAPSAYQRFAGEALSGVWAEVVVSPSTDCDGVPVIPPAPGDITIVPLRIESNGEYIAPSGIAYSPVVAAVPTGPAMEDVPLIVECNGETETPEGVRYNPITVNVPQQTATDVNLFTRTHTLRGLTIWNPNNPIQDIRGWQLTLWGGGSSVYSITWSSSGDVVMGVSEGHTNAFIQVIDMLPGQYRVKFFYKNGTAGGLYMWGRNPWNGTAAGNVDFFRKNNSTEWTEVDEVITVPSAGRWRVCIGQSSQTSQWFYLSRPFFTPIGSGASDYVPAASDITEGYYDNAEFNE